MAMTKKHYSIVARHVKELFESYDPLIYTEYIARRRIELFITTMARDFEDNDIKFDKDKFLEACGL